MSSEVEIPWDNIRAALTFGGAVDVGLDDVNVDLGGAVTANVNLGLSGAVTANANVDLSGEVTANANLGGSIDAGLDNLRLKELPTIETVSAVRVTELPVIRTDSKVDLGLDDIRIRELPPVQLELAMRPFRLHLPLNFKFRFELLGIKLFEFSVCGEGMAIGEEYQRRRTEECG